MSNNLENALSRCEGDYVSDPGDFGGNKVTFDAKSWGPFPQ